MDGRALESGHSFQRKVIPLILRGKDTFIEFSFQKGKTVAFALPLLLQLRRDEAGIKAIVLASNTESAIRIFGEFENFQPTNARTRNRSLIKASDASGEANLFVGLLSENNEIRSELNNLGRRPDIIVSEPKRLIDHLRRGNVEFADEVTLSKALEGRREL